MAALLLGGFAAKIAADSSAGWPTLRLSEHEGHEAQVVRSRLGEDLRALEKDNRRAATISAGSVDLNGDGKLEIVAIVTHSGTCGSGGCMTTVLAQGDDGTWTPVLDALAGTIEVGTQRSKDFCDLIVDRSAGFSRVYRWDGRRYHERLADDSAPSSPPRSHAGECRIEASRADALLAGPIPCHDAGLIPIP